MPHAGAELTPAEGPASISRFGTRAARRAPAEYRARWGLPADYPMVAPDYAEKRRVLAKQIGLGRKPGQKRGRKKKAA